MFSKPLVPVFRFFTFAYILCFFSCQNADHSNQEAGAISAPKAGAAIFNENCKLCHGSDGRLGLNGAKDLTVSKMLINERVNIITHGKNLMTPFGGLLQRAEIDSVAAYTLKLSQTTTND